MDVGIIGGIIVGIVLIFTGIAINGGSVVSFVDIASILIVLGGSIAAALVNFKPAQVFSMWHLARVALTTQLRSPQEVIRLMVRFAEKARREGLLAMEDEVERLDDEFLKKGMGLVVDGTDPETVRQILDIELTFLEDRHRLGQQLFDHMGASAPAFGMLGTLIGLIIMLGNLDNPETIGPAMAIALITTFYGVLFANLIFLPVAGKLRLKSDEEILLREMMIEGILSIQAGENPHIVEQKLQSFIAPRLRGAARGESEGAPRAQRVAATRAQ